MRDFSDDGGLDLIVSVIPTKEQFGELHPFSVFQDRVMAWCRKREVLCLDPRARFDEIGADRIYLSWDPHFSVEGHQRYAEFLYDQTRLIIVGAL